MKNIKRITLILVLIGTTFSIAQESIFSKEKLVGNVHDNDMEYDSIENPNTIKKEL